MPGTPPAKVRASSGRSVPHAGRVFSSFLWGLPVEPQTRDITQLLVDVSRGRADATEELLPLVYDELRKLAQSRMRRERPDHTLQATALVHEAYIRLVDQTRITFHSRAQFFSAASRAIRQILVDSARRKRSLKRGGDWERVELEPAIAEADRLDILALDEALTQLAGADPRAARVVELRVFGGVSIEQAAEMLGVSHATIERDWSAARAWLLARLSESAGA
ncbi:MAG: sigma-70 family RNA polymerase sigma factor [Phycisphaeraceae bacterium]|nr:sigma-70 family RNA polymerase sigma factor [Phycisphaeraceae bacterium]